MLKLSKIGEMPIILHRPVPDGFTLKTCTIVKKADGWYACISIEDATVPELLPLAEVKAVVGIDVGLKDFLTTSDGETIPIQQTYRKTQAHLARQQRKLARKQKGSKLHEKQKNKIARIHQRIGRKRQDFHYNTAHKLVKQFDLIAVEDLNINGLARTRLSKLNLSQVDISASSVPPTLK
ncbi:MAG: transposase [Coleofasciculus sp. G1-WW12-02]|uniref:RNA-guided endonuclease InsQ/TnpB family protein n=1 Tax=Coleofasciculus sp. G1-WW12-02 TaxID=3068483 RepID=UPI0032F84253